MYRVFIAVILFLIIVGFRFYLDKPYIHVINPGIESLYSLSVNMASVFFGETRKTMAAICWVRAMEYHTETSHEPYWAFYIIKDETIDKLRKENIDNKKLQSIESLKNRKFPTSELLGKLKDMSLNKEEIDLLFRYAIYWNARPDVKRPENLYIYEGTQMLPILRLITWLDPGFIKAYDFGGYFLAINLDKPEDGIAFLEEGIRNNPESYDLYQGLAFIYFNKMKDYPQAIRCAKRALDITLKVDYTSSHKEMDCVNSLRILGHSYRLMEDYIQAERYFFLIRKVDSDFIDLSKKLIKDMKSDKYILINQKMIDTLTEKISPDKLEKLRKFKDKEFSKRGLTVRLKILEFTQEEIDEVIKAK
ncbi:MAG TPA: tetratricopeptide repeat protein [Candidatus Eremiobacteraeota bacterium]|nr:tetratricopeptide repeat protein [Candidatus Eremiobacteraeota bacterium]